MKNTTRNTYEGLYVPTPEHFDDVTFERDFENVTTTMDEIKDLYEQWSMKEKGYNFGDFMEEFFEPAEDWFVPDDINRYMNDSTELELTEKAFNTYVNTDPLSIDEVLNMWGVPIEYRTTGCFEETFETANDLNDFLESLDQE